MPDAERTRLEEDGARTANWKRWGPYLAERQWGTVREDYSADGSCWDYLTHDHARSRAYRWGEDGLLGFTDRECRLCFAVALWNGADPILKERLFGLTGPQGNHGEDVKECYYYLDATPTHSYMKALYKYPQRAFPYARLVEENARRGRQEPEFEIADAGMFEGGRYFDVTVEYAKAAPDDILIRITIANRGPEPAPIAVLPTLWFRNTWSWGRTGEGYWPRPEIRSESDGTLLAQHATLGAFRFAAVAAAGEEAAAGKAAAGATAPEWLFTENETNTERLFGARNRVPFVKDAFHEYVVARRTQAVNPERRGTKAAALHRVTLPAGGETTLRLRLYQDGLGKGHSPAEFDRTFAARQSEADDFYSRLPRSLDREELRVARQAAAGLLWTKQFFHFVVR